MNNKKKSIIVISALCLFLGGGLIWQNVKLGNSERNLSDEALLALIKNDQKAFESVIEAKVDLQENLPVIDGKKYAISEGLVYFERPNFIGYLQSKKIKFIHQGQKDYDLLSLSIPKNNPELLDILLLEKPIMNATYGEKKWSLLHLASAICSHKLTSILHEKAKLSWDLRAKDGSTPLTLAAENDCLPMLSYWKDQNADFKKKDGRGLSALAILKKKKDAALVAFAESFEERQPASKPVDLNFYKKRKIPKDQVIDHAALIEPDLRPMEASETAEFSEFAD